MDHTTLDCFLYDLLLVHKSHNQTWAAKISRQAQRGGFPLSSALARPNMVPSNKETHPNKGKAEQGVAARGFFCICMYACVYMCIYIYPARSTPGPLQVDSCESCIYRRGSQGSVSPRVAGWVSGPGLKGRARSRAHRRPASLTSRQRASAADFWEAGLWPNKPSNRLRGGAGFSKLAGFRRLPVVNGLLSMSLQLLRRVWTSESINEVVVGWLLSGLAQVTLFGGCQLDLRQQAKFVTIWTKASESSFSA